MMIYLLMAVITACTLTYLTFRFEWFYDSWYGGTHPVAYLLIAMASMFWPLGLLAVPIFIAVYFGKKHRKH